MSSPFPKEGEVVWVAVGDRHEEPALVLKTGCDYSDEESDDDESEGHDSASNNTRRPRPSKGASKRGGKRADGILVQLSVSMIKGIYPPSKVRSMADEEKGAESQRRPRRKNGGASAPLPLRKGSSGTRSAGSEEGRAMESTPSTSRTQGSKKRLTVTPSPSSSSATSSTATVATSTVDEGRSSGSRRGSKKMGTSAKPQRPARRAPTDRSTTSPHFNKGRSEIMSADSSEGQLDDSSTTSRSDSEEAPPSVPHQRAGRRAAVATARQNDGKPRAVPAAASNAASQKVGKAQPSKKKPKIEVVRDSSDSDSDSDVVEVNAAGDPKSNGDSEDDDDAPFTVEYSPTGRATCRRCDHVISRNCLRVSHTPLFRGKPGYKVYRHLDCTVFSEEIYCVQDVGGYGRLTEPDLERLRQRVVASRKEWEDEKREIQPDELVQLAFSGPIRPPPKGLAATLLPFQVEGASWMYAQEQSEVRGGMLADEMGMGKTIQTIATILDNRPKLQHARPGAKHPPSAPDLDDRVQEEAKWQEAANGWRHEMEMNNVNKKVWPKGGTAVVRAGTLVVCPVIALSQWKSEIEKFTDPGTLSVGIYHGPDREKIIPREILCKYDVVLTTYQVLEQDFRKMVSPNKVACPNCGAKYKIDKLRVHLKYFCGEGAQRTEAQMRQRRTASRPGRSNEGRNGGGAGKGGSKTMASKKPLIAKEKARKDTATSPPAKSKLKIRSIKGYDSDSELSLEDASVGVGRSSRPSRSAAVNAKRRVSESFKELNSTVATERKSGNDDYDDESYSGAESGSSESDESLRGSTLVSAKKSSRKQAITSAGIRNVGTAPDRKRPRVDSSSDEDDSLDDEALARARATQEKALAAARQRKKNFQKSKKGKEKPASRGKKKKFDDQSSSDESTDNDDDVDPLEGIDMDELMDEAMAGARFSVLHGFTWWRCVLDEAHFIKSRSSQTAASAFALTSVHRWCLSGTPLQNRVGELYSLIRFVRLDPMSHYFCRQCTCKSIHYRMRQGVCQDCGHRAFSHFSHFNKHVLNPIQRDGYTGDGRRAVFILKGDVLDKCLLRRTKESRAEDMNLPPRLVTIRPVRLHPVEEDFYNALYTQTKSSFDDYVAEGTVLNNYAHIFDLLTKMRQAVNHPYLIVYSSSEKVRLLHQSQRASPQVANGSVDCEMCHDPPVERVTSSCCGSGFCRSCVVEYLTGAVGSNTLCPSCSRPFTIDLNQASSDDGLKQSSLDGEHERVLCVGDEFRTVDSSPGSKLGSDTGSTYAAPTLKQLPHVATGSILRRINLAEFATSTKIEVLVQELTEMRQNRPGNKALVFSQFVNMLDLIRWRLHSDPCLVGLGLGVRILHGGMDAKSRDAALKDFREDSSCRVLLMSLKAAGVALNLTVASECYLTDLWWNPAAEMQAIDRTHRLGQYRPIRAVRLVAEGTVEERVLQLQEKKRLVFDGTIGRDAGSLKMLTVDDMVALFS